MPKPVSQRQARFFGAIAGGVRRVKGFSRAEARTRLRGVNISRLPRRAIATRGRPAPVVHNRRRRR
jgi:hypothetical protein